MKRKTPKQHKVTRKTKSGKVVTYSRGKGSGSNKKGSGKAYGELVASKSGGKRKKVDFYSDDGVVSFDHFVMGVVDGLDEKLGKSIPYRQVDSFIKKNKSKYVKKDGSYPRSYEDKKLLKKILSDIKKSPKPKSESRASRIKKAKKFAKSQEYFSGKTNKVPKL